MNRKMLLYMLLLLGTVAQSKAYFTVDKTLWQGYIKFPSNVSEITPVRVYYMGNIIRSEIDKAAHKISFAISEYKTCRKFYVIIADCIDFNSDKNSVEYLKVPTGRPYKLYEIEFIPNAELDPSSLDADVEKRGTWKIRQMRLNDDLRIPDNAIIICYHAHLVKNLEGGNAIELPTVMLNPEVLAKLTEDELNDASAQFLLSALNCDSFHTLPETQIKPDIAHKTVITLTT